MSIKLNEYPHLWIRLYDKPGTIDRFTLVILDHRNDDMDFYALSHNPSHPQGVGMFCGSAADGYQAGSHLGKQLNSIPSNLLKAVFYFANLYYEVN